MFDKFFVFAPRVFRYFFVEPAIKYDFPGCRDFGKHNHNLRHEELRQPQLQALRGDLEQHNILHDAIPVLQKKALSSSRNLLRRRLFWTFLLASCRRLVSASANYRWHVFLHLSRKTFITVFSLFVVSFTSSCTPVVHDATVHDATFSPREWNVFIHFCFPKSFNFSSDEAVSSCTFSESCVGIFFLGITKFVCSWQWTEQSRYYHRNFPSLITVSDIFASQPQHSSRGLAPSHRSFFYGSDARRNGDARAVQMKQVTDGTRTNPQRSNPLGRQGQTSRHRDSLAYQREWLLAHQPTQRASTRQFRLFTV